MCMGCDHVTKNRSLTLHLHCIQRNCDLWMVVHVQDCHSESFIDQKVVEDIMNLVIPGAFGLIKSIQRAQKGLRIYLHQTLRH
ncbi:hypothetical protein F7725_008722 [Dissostichus mawsoni]|uniref:Uncharacterized protein n=1 Tax=Dissostichus mawsoni TaxID=36200 RepID=A0A7J5Y9W8_DISMA|nr:hypothetical protein F7725_008722 [Dissostichus mawsoni]